MIESGTKKTSNIYGLRFHHLGLVTNAQERALKFLKGLGYTEGPCVRDVLQNANLQICTGNGMPNVELIMPTEIKGHVDNLLSLNGEMFYHVCYETDNLEASLSALKTAGNRVIPVADRKPAVLFGNQVVSFYKISGFGLIEIVEKESQ